MAGCSSPNVHFLSSVATRIPRLPGLHRMRRQYAQKRLEIHRLDDVGVEAGLAGFLLVVFLSPAGKGHQYHILAPGL